MMIRKFLILLCVLLTISGFVSRSEAEPILAIQYLVYDFGIFNVGDLVDMQQVTTMEDFYFASLPDIYTLTIYASGADLDSLAYLIVTQDIDGTLLSSVETRPFSLNRWMQESGGDGSFTNQELAALKYSEWFPINYGNTIRAETEAVLDKIESGNFVSSTLTTTIELYYYSQNTVTLEENSGLWQTYTNSKQIYNPSAPVLQTPAIEEVVTSTPVLFTWDWFGGSADMSIIIVQGMLGDDPESVIASRTPYNTIYDGDAQYTRSHTHISTVGLDALSDNYTYYWQVSAEVPTIVPGITKTFRSVPRYFIYRDNNLGAGLDDLGGGLGLGQGEPTGSSPLPESFEPGLPGSGPGGGIPGGPPDPGGSGASPLDPEATGGAGAPPATPGQPVGTPGRAPGRGAEPTGAPGEPGQAPQDDPLDPEVRQIVNALALYLPPEIITLFETELNNGSTIDRINIPGIENANLQQLLELLREPGVSIRSASFAD